jgi:electron transport complex protein RnfG
MSAPLIIQRDSLRLTLFAIVCALILGGIYQWTLAPIAQQQMRITQGALDEIFPQAEHDNPWHQAYFELDAQSAQELGNPAQRRVYVATRDNKIVGFVLPFKTAQGYSGDIELLMGVFTDGRIAAVRVISHKETPGLGDKIDIKRSSWINSFQLKSLTNPTESLWAVKKDKGEFDQFAGATITPRACVGAIKQALGVFHARQGQWQSAYLNREQQP